MKVVGSTADDFDMINSMVVVTAHSGTFATKMCCANLLVLRVAC